MEDNTLYNNFLNYCISKLGKDDTIETFVKMVVYKDILIYKDVIVNILKVDGNNLIKFVEKNNIPIAIFQLDNLPSNAVYQKKEKITNRNNIWFVNLEQFIRITITYKNDNACKFINYLIKIHSMLVNFMEDYGGTFMIERKHLTDELLEKIVKIQLIEKDIIEYKARITELNYKNIANNEKFDHLRNEMIKFVKKLVPQTALKSASLFNYDSDVESDISIDSNDDNNSDNDSDNNDDDEYEDENKKEKEKFKNIHGTQVINNIKLSNILMRNFDLIIKEPIDTYYKEINSMIKKPVVACC